MEQKIFLQEYLKNYLVFIPAKKYIQRFRGTTRIVSWKSNGISEEIIEIITESDCNIAPFFVDHHELQDVKFNGHCLINNNICILKSNKNIYLSCILIQKQR